MPRNKMTGVWTKVDGRDTLLDRAMPQWHHRERHSVRVAASSTQVWDQLVSAPASRLRLTRLLMALRTGRIAAPPPGLKLIDALPPKPIALNYPSELLMGFYYPTAAGRAAKRAVGRDWNMARPASLEEFMRERPGWTRLAMNFLLVEEGDSVQLVTETRAFTSTPEARRSFARYWMLIRAGSGLIRREILRVVAANRSTRTNCAKHNGMVQVHRSALGHRLFAFLARAPDPSPIEIGEKR